MALLAVPGGGAGGGGGNFDYTLVSVSPTFRVTSDNQTKPIVQVTAQSNMYGVTYTWFIERATWDTDGGPPAIGEKTAEVNEVCGLDHVIGFRTEQDQDASGLLYNYAVITVGTEDESIQDETRVRMDQLQTGAPQTQTAAVWARLQAAGAQ